MALKPQVRTVLAYVIVASLWIWLSNLVLRRLVSDTETLSLWQSVKGTVFVVVTGVLLYVMIDRDYRRMKRSNLRLLQGNERGNDGTPPQFTDYGLIAIGVPRNRDIPANRDPAFHDLGLCGPLRTDFLGREEYCGLFRTPTLRNVALRKVFFHNGGIHSLKDAVRFYVERETHPERWYSRQPDAQLGLFEGGISMGQILSVPMIVAGIIMMIWAYRRRPQPQFREEK